MHLLCVPVGTEASDGARLSLLPKVGDVQLHEIGELLSAVLWLRWFHLDSAAFHLLDLLLRRLLEHHWEVAIVIVHLWPQLLLQVSPEPAVFALILHGLIFG